MAVVGPGSVTTGVYFYGQNQGGPDWVELRADVNDTRLGTQFPGYDAASKAVWAHLPFRGQDNNVHWTKQRVDGLVGIGHADAGHGAGNGARFRLGLSWPRVDPDAIRTHGVAFTVESNVGSLDVQSLNQNTMPQAKAHAPDGVGLPPSRTGWWQVNVLGRSWLYNNPELAKQAMQEWYDRGAQPYARAHRGPSPSAWSQYPFGINPLGPNFR